jgi:hypothetical protein
MGLIVVMRPAPTLQLAFQDEDWRWALRWTLTLGDFGKYKNAQ